MSSGMPFQNLPYCQPSAGLSLLKGVKVVDLTTSIAGPYATMLLSDFGAEVIKIEKNEGDDARAWGPPFIEGESLWFTSVNRNKKSVVLNLNDADDRKKIDKIIATADVFVTNQPPRVQKKLGLSFDDVKKIKSDIIFTSITGFGLEGERADLTCYDLIAEGYSGVMDLTGEIENGPQKIGTPAADLLSGQDAAMATMAALFERKTSGTGHLIDVSLVESMTRFLTPRISTFLGSGEVPRRAGGKDSVISVYQPFETADKPINLGLGNDGIWKRFCAAAGLEEYGSQEGFETNAKRRERREEIVKTIQEKLLSKTREEWLTIFRDARVPAGPINRIDEVSMDKILQDRGMFYTLKHGEREIPQIGLGIFVDGKTAKARSAPPLLGEHTKEITSES